MALAVLATACGGGSGGGESGSADAIDPTGVLRLPGDFSLPAIGLLDPVKVTASLAGQNLTYLYGSLLRRKPDGTVEPGLAKEVKVVDASNLTVTLKPDLKFSDGTPVDADALKFSWERLVKEGQPGAQEAEFKEFESLTVVSATELKVKLKSPIAGAFYRLMHLNESAPVSPTAVRSGVDFNTNPVGAGPFKLEKVDIANQTLKFVKNPTYWDAENIKIAGINYVNAAPSTYQTAVRSGVIDFAGISAPDATTLTGVAGYTISVAPSNAVNLVGFFCKNRPPFDNVKVRQALNFAIDREALNLAVYDGKGEPMAGFNSSATPYYDKTLKDYYTYNPTKAKSLLAEANVTNLTFTLLFPPGSDGQKGSEVLQRQLAAVGVTANLVPATGTSDFFPNAVKGPAYFFNLVRVGLPKVSRTLVPGTFGNPCEWNDPELNALVAQLRAVPEESPEGIALWKKISENGMKNALWLFGVFGTQPYAVNNRLGGFVKTEIASGQPTPEIHGLYIKK
jgi:peptide/nickel transport system substrate-binding protein